MKSTILTLVLAGTASALPGKANISTCGNEFTTFSKCIEDNANTCSDCSVVGPVGNPFQAGFCDATANSLCHGFGCCEPCEAEFETYETCFADLISSVTFGGCEINCEDATTPTVSPTENPNPTTSSTGTCLDKLDRFRTCIGTNEDTCSSCSILGATSNPFESGFCWSVNAAICAVKDCCQACGVEFEEYKDCTSDFVKVMSFGQCGIDCENEEDEAIRFADTLNDQGCLDHFTSYASCVAQNPLVCGSCVLMNLPNNPFETGFCDSATQTICSVGSCCTPCSGEFQKFDDCFEDVVTDLSAGSCNIECEKHESKGNCLAKVNEYTDCVADNALECGTCALLNIPTNAQDDEICDIAKHSFCGFSNCCTPCEIEYDGMDECFEDFMELVTQGQCDLDCDNYVSDTPANCIESFNEYSQCVQNQPISCLGCAASYLPSNPLEAGFCSSITTSLCQMGGCCDECADEFNRFDECYETFVATISFGNCEVECDTFNPTIALAPPLDSKTIDEADVNDAHANYSACIEKYQDKCSNCYLPNPVGGLFDKFEGANFCDSAGYTVCSVEDCCDDCSDELETLTNVLAEHVSSVSNQECVFPCINK